jgi:hypothetical protein
MCASHAMFNWIPACAGMTSESACYLNLSEEQQKGASPRLFVG